MWKLIRWPAFRSIEDYKNNSCSCCGTLIFISGPTWDPINESRELVIDECWLKIGSAVVLIGLFFVEEWIDPPDVFPVHFSSVQNIGLQIVRFVQRIGKAALLGRRRRSTASKWIIIVLYVRKALLCCIAPRHYNKVQVLLLLHATSWRTQRRRRIKKGFVCLLNGIDQCLWRRISQTEQKKN